MLVICGRCCSPALLCRATSGTFASRCCHFMYFIASAEGFHIVFVFLFDFKQDNSKGYEHILLKCYGVIEGTILADDQGENYNKY